MHLHRVALLLLAATIALPEGLRHVTQDFDYDNVYRGNTHKPSWRNSLWRALPFSPRWFASRFKNHSELNFLTRYGNLDDELQFPLLRPRVLTMTRRVDACVDDRCMKEDPRVKPRIASPFEHVCGGARGIRDIEKGHDGPTQWMSFSNAVDYPNVAADCNQTWDIGQRRMFVSERDVRKMGGFVVDLSDEKKAWRWCYEGGKLTSSTGKSYYFKGAKKIKAWPYKCANIAFQVTVKRGFGHASESWWNEPGNRKLIAKRCVKWANEAREVLILPNPNKIEQGDTNNEIMVNNDREPAIHMCTAGLLDRCTSFDRDANTVTCSGNPQTINSPNGLSTRGRARVSGRSMRVSSRVSGSERGQRGKYGSNSNSVRNLQQHQQDSQQQSQRQQRQQLHGVTSSLKRTSGSGRPIVTDTKAVTSTSSRRIASSSKPQQRSSRRSNSARGSSGIGKPEVMEVVPEEKLPAAKKNRRRSSSEQKAKKVAAASKISGSSKPVAKTVPEANLVAAPSPRSSSSRKRRRSSRKRKQANAA